MLRLLPGFYVEDNLWIREGETLAIPGMDGYFLKNIDFILERHGNESVDAPMMSQGVNAMAKNYQSDVVLYKQPKGALPGDTSNLQKLQEYSIRVNHPLEQDDYSIYQMDYKQDELKTMYFNLTNKATGKSLGEVAIDLSNPQTTYELGNGARVELLTYLPDFQVLKKVCRKQLLVHRIILLLFLKW